MKRIALSVFLFVLVLFVSCSKRPSPPAVTATADTAGGSDITVEATTAATTIDVPSTTEVPATTDTPETTAAPATTEAPATTVVPVTTAAPATTAAPVTTKAPETTAAPVTTEAPVTTTAPETTEPERIEESQGIFYKANNKWYFLNSERFYLPNESEGGKGGNIPFVVPVSPKFNLYYVRGEDTVEPVCFQYTSQGTAVPGQGRTPVLFLDEKCGLSVQFFEDGSAELCVSYDSGATFSSLMTVPYQFDTYRNAEISITISGNLVFVVSPVSQSLFQSTAENGLWNHSSDLLTYVTTYQQILRFRYENGIVTEAPYADSDPAILREPFDLSVSEPAIFYTITVDGETLVISGILPYSYKSQVNPNRDSYHYYFFFLYSTDGGETWNFYDPRSFQY